MFGDITIAPVTTTAPPATVAPNKLQNALNTAGSVLTNIVKPAADIYTQVKPGGPGSSSSTPTYSPGVTTPATVAPAPESSTKKYLIVGGVLVLAGTAVYFMTRKKKK